MSWAARGLLIFLLGKPDDWQVSPAALTKETQDLSRGTGRDGVYAILKELNLAGYLKPLDARAAAGTFGNADYIITEMPSVVFEPHTPKPDTANPDTVKVPCAAQPDTAEPYTANPDTVQPCAAQPYPAQPYPANPPQVRTDSYQGLKKNQGLNIAKAPAALSPVVKKSQKLVVVPEKPQTAVETENLQTACRATWTAYASAYKIRHGIAPIRNKLVNTHVKQFVQRIGYLESPDVAAFFVSAINETFVVKGMHQTGLLLKNCEAYRTQWATGNTMTTTRAHQIDQSQANYDAAGEALAIWRAKRNIQNAQ